MDKAFLYSYALLLKLILEAESEFPPPIEIENGGFTKTGLVLLCEEGYLAVEKIDDSYNIRENTLLLTKFKLKPKQGEEGIDISWVDNRLCLGIVHK